MISVDALWQAARIIVACALCYGASVLIGLQEGYWALVTAVVVTQPALDRTLSAGRDRVVGTLIGALAGLGVILVSRYGFSSVVLFWIAMVPLTILTAIKPNLRLCCITLIIVVLVPSGGDPFLRPLQRVIEILLGTAASIVTTAALPMKGND